MAIVRWTPAGDLAGLHSALDRLFGDIFGDAGRTSEAQRGGRAEVQSYHLLVNIAETDEGNEIEAHVPGFRPEDVKVTFADGVLSIDARRSEEKERREGNYLRRELAYGHYRRQVALPGDVRADDIRASIDNGVLRVVVPKAARPKPVRIRVQPGERQKQLAGAGSRRKG